MDACFFNIYQTKTDAKDIKLIILTHNDTFLEIMPFVTPSLNLKIISEFF